MTEERTPEETFEDEETAPDVRTDPVEEPAAPDEEDGA